MHRTFRYPLRPTPAQEIVLVQWLGVCCDLYNAALQERREGHKRGIKCSYVTQTKALTEIRANDPTLAAMSVEVQRSALDRLEGSFDGFFQRVKAGSKPGYPRHRAKRRYDSFSYPVLVKNIVCGTGRAARLSVPVLGAIKVNAYRPLQGAPKTVTIRRDATGRWWACVSCDLGAAPTPPDPSTITPDDVLGVDMGITSLAAFSDGTILPNPRHFQRSASKLAQRQRNFARKKKGSKSRNRTQVLVAKTHAHIANQRANVFRKSAKDIVGRCKAVIFEDLNIVGLASGMLGKHVNLAAWNRYRQAVACKAEEAGKLVLFVDPRHTSQLCSGCGALVPKELDERWHHCDVCGISLDRDVNAARVIKARGVAALGTSVVEAPAKAVRPNRRSKRTPAMSERL